MLIRLRGLLAILCAVHFVRFWILPGRDGLWVDETGTYWTIAGGWDQLWVRTAMHPNSRIYGALIFVWTRLMGTSEFALRLPSLLAMLGSFAVMTVFLRRRLGAGTAWPVVALCLASPELSFFAIEARPYAFALLMLAISTVAWVKLHEKMTWGRAALWVFSSGLLVHFQPVVAVALSGQALWFVWRVDWRSMTARRALAWCGIAVAAALVALPEVSRIFPLVIGDNVSALPGTPPAASAIKVALPVSILVPASFAACALLLFRKWRPVSLDGTARELALLGFFLVASTVGLCAGYSMFSNYNVLLPRYMIAVYPGCFLMVGALLARWTDENGRLWFALLYSGSTLALSVAGQGWVPIHADADWRGAMTAVRQWEQDRPAPLLLQSGFIEGSRFKILKDPKWREFLSAPALYYRHSGPTYVLPFRTYRSHQPYMDELIRRVDGQRFAVVLYSTPGETPPYITLLAARHGPPRLLERFRRLDVYTFGPP